MSSQATGKVLSGIGPIDKVLGGLEQGRCHLLVGRPGSGKTTFGAQFLITSLNKDERVIVVTRLSAQEVVDRFAKLGYDYFAHGESNDRLIIFEQSDEIVEHIRNLDDFSAVATELEETIKEHKPARVVFDPTSYLIEAETLSAREGRARELVDLLTRVQTTSLLIIDEVDNDAVIGPLTRLCSNVFYLNAKPGEKGASILGFAKVENPAGSGHEMPVQVNGTTGITAALGTAPLRPVPGTQRLETLPAVSFDVPTAFAPPPVAPLIEPVAPKPVQPQPTPAPQPVAAVKPQPTTAFNAEPTHTEKFHVLVIDDDPATCNLISRALRQDCEVTAVNDGASGLKKLASGNTYDLIILDVNLPVVDGFHICQHIRKTQWQVPIIIVTGTHLRAEDRLHSASAGGDLYLTKPFSVHELRLRVRQMIGRYRNVSEWVGAGAGMGLESAISESVSPEPEEQFVAYDVFLQRLSRHTERARTVGLPFSIVGCTLTTNGNGSNKASRMVDAVRYQIRERDVMTVTPERQSFVLLSEANVDGVQVFVQRLRQSIITEVGADPVIQWRTYPIDGENATELLTEVQEDLKSEALAVARDSSSFKNQPTVISSSPVEPVELVDEHSDDTATFFVPDDPEVEVIDGGAHHGDTHEIITAPPVAVHSPEEPFFEFVIEEEEILREGDSTLSNMGAHVPKPAAEASHTGTQELSAPTAEQVKTSDTDERPSEAFAFSLSESDSKTGDVAAEIPAAHASNEPAPAEQSKELVLPQQLNEPEPVKQEVPVTKELAPVSQPEPEVKSVVPAFEFTVSEPTQQLTPPEPVASTTPEPVHPELQPQPEPQPQAAAPESKPEPEQPLPAPKPEPRAATPTMWTEPSPVASPAEHEEVPAFATFFDNSFEQYRQIVESLNVQPVTVEKPVRVESAPRESFLQFLAGRN